MSWSTSELRVRLAPLNWFKPSSKIFYWPFQGGTSFVDHLCFFLFCFCYAFVLCGHLLVKGWPLCSRLCCPLWVCHFPIGILSQVWYLIVLIPDLCTLTYLHQVMIYCELHIKYELYFFLTIDYRFFLNCQKFLKTRRCDPKWWRHFNTLMTQLLVVFRRASVRFFYHSHGLVWVCGIEYSQMGKNSWNLNVVCKNIRTNNEYEGWIEKSVSRINDWHHEACQVMTIGDREGRIIYPILTRIMDYFHAHQLIPQLYTRKNL